MTKLLALFVKMQAQAAAYVETATYHSLDKHKTTASSEDHARRDLLFIGDILYMLDGPEQREAQAEAEGGKVVWEKRTRIGACETITRVYDQDAPSSVVVSGPIETPAVIKEAVQEDDTFDAEQIAAAELALSRAKVYDPRVHTQIVDFPDEPKPGVDTV